MANYLYNGIELPELPEWDKETYPYAVIFHDPMNLLYTKGAYHLLLSPEPFAVWHVDTTPLWGVSEDTAVGFRSYVEPDFVWQGSGFGSSGWDGHRADNLPLVWSNHDITNTTDNSVWLAASEPVPATPDLDPTSFLAGWRLGCIAREYLRG